MSEYRIPRLRADAAMVVPQTGKPTPLHIQWWQSLVKQIEAQEIDQNALIAALQEAQTAIEATQADLSATQADLAAAVADIAAAQVAADAAQADATQAQADAAAVAGDLSGYVAKDQTPAWATPSGTVSRATFTAYAGQTVSASPTQAEVQAIDDALEVNSRRLAALITDLRAANVLT